jgi:hypothetical protein
MKDLDLRIAEKWGGASKTEPRTATNIFDEGNV